MLQYGQPKHINERMFVPIRFVVPVAVSCKARCGNDVKSISIAATPSGVDCVDVVQHDVMRSPQLCPERHAAEMK